MPLYLIVFTELLTNDNQSNKSTKKVNFGYDKMDDYLVHKNDDRRARFRARFDKIYQKYKNDYNKPIYWFMNLTW
jgi:hypothetical protein